MKETQKNLEVGQMIKSDKIIFELGKNEKIHVKHVIKYGELGDKMHQNDIEILTREIIQILRFQMKMGML